MLRFIFDLLIYPFDKDKENNKFSKFLTMLFKDYPAFLWIKPNFKKIILLPFLVLFHFFKRK
jgi:hypothetical protein